MAIFKVDAEGDTLYIEAETQVDAALQLTQKVGPIPASMLTWTEVDALPDGEVLL